MGLFSEIANGTFFQDVSDAWTGDKGSDQKSLYTSYPLTLGNNTDYGGANWDLSYDSSPEVGAVANSWTSTAGQDVRKVNIAKTDPFMMFEFFRLNEDDTTVEDAFKTLTKTDGYTVDETATDGAQAAQHVKGVYNQALNIGENVISAGKEIVKKTKRKIVEDNGRICLYMPPGINITDNMNYDQQSRKLAAALGEYINSGGGLDYAKTLKTEDLYVMGAQAGSAIGGGIGYFLTKASKGILMGGATAGGAAGGMGLADELLRRKGKVMNPNEYMQYTNTALRSFSFQWKFLPDSAKESKACQDIIKRFRGSAHANRKSAITLSVPDQVVVSFHGATGLAGLPPLVITSTNVTYNPNSASFFEVDGTPVEIDFSVTLNEITPIYRDDVELKGY